MGYYLQIDTQEPQPVASLTGWGDVIRWVGTLSPAAAPSLHHLTQYGWDDAPGKVRAELVASIKTDAPTSDQTKGTLDNLIVLLEGADNATVVSVTDGLGAEGDKS